MADDNVTIWGSGLKFGRKPANGQLLIGDGVGFKLANLSSGSGVTITDSAGGIQISATGSGGTVTGVTATSPLSSSGGAAPDISLTGTVAVNRGGTGAATLPLNNVILGNGTGAVQTVAPGANGNVLTSNGTTFISSAPAAPYFAKAQVTDGTLATQTLTGAVNIASCTRSGTSTYTITFTNAAPNTDYAVSVTIINTPSNIDRIISGGITRNTGSLVFTTYRGSGATPLTVNSFDILVFT